MRIAREEIFGPVVSILRWSDEDDLSRASTRSTYGLTASIWTHDLDRAHRLASRVEAGYIWINGASPHYVGVPFGGYKQSGIGREESIEELLACTQIKNVNVTLQTQRTVIIAPATDGTCSRRDIEEDASCIAWFRCRRRARRRRLRRRRAEELAVGNYGVSANGMPFGVALVKGYFKEEGLNVTGLISSAGGGTSLRNMLAGGGVPYGEVNPGRRSSPRSSRAPTSGSSATTCSPSPSSSGR